MKQAMQWTILALLLAAAGPARAQFPVQDMNRYTLGLDYTLAFRGEDITQAGVPSHEILHVVGLAYAPVPYVALQAGLGIDRFSVDSYKQVSFDGDYGFSPALGLSLYSPFFLFDMLRVSGEGHAVYLDSRDSRGFAYSGFISTASLGLIFSASAYLDLAAGGRLHLIDGSMSSPHGAVDQPFSNKQTTRGYFAVTLKTPSEGAFLTLDLDASPNVDWSNGPREATIGISFGALLGGKGKTEAPAEQPAYFPAYSEMKEKEKKMAEEIK
jgi:hypothetical protein